jgi:hypothetical protein
MFCRGWVRYVVFFCAQTAVRSVGCGTSNNVTTPLDWEAYPSFTDCLEAARPLAQPNNAFWVRLKSVVTSQPVTRILVVGGSETAGVQCEDGELKLKACAWPSRLARWLQTQFNQTRIVVDNQASGGTTITAALPVLGTWLSSAPDVVLVDFIVNDAFEPQDKSSAGNLIAAYEAFIEQTRATHSEANLAFVITCALERCTHVRDIILWVSAIHNVVVFSFHDVAHCAVQMRSGDDGVLGVYWDVQGPHPSWRTHQLIADTISSIAGANLGCFEDTRASLTGADVLEKLRFCSTPSSLYSSALASAHGGGIMLRNWKLEEDRPGKLGWITHSNNSAITFNLTFGETPRLMVTWLKSYEKLGKVRMTLAGKSVELSGRYDVTTDHSARVSQAFMHTFQVQKAELQTELGLSGVLGFGVQPHSNHSLLFETLPELAVNGESKFKLISISTC